MADREFQIRTEIPEPNYERFLDTLEHLNKRAEKIDSPPIEFRLHGTENRVFDKDTGEMMRWYDVEVSGLVPVIEGWTMVAVIDHEHDDGNMLRRVPSDEEIEIPERFRTAASNCDHCGYDRIRNETFLLAKDGEYRQVGRNCLSDFGGNASTVRRLELLDAVREEIMSAADFELDPSPEGFYLLDIENYLATVAAVIEEHGWLSKGKAREIGLTLVTPTSEKALDYILEMRKPACAREVAIDITAEHEDVAKDALAWVRDELGNATDLNDYEWNLTVACGTDALKMKDMGIVASLIPAYHRATGEWTLGHDDDEETPTSEHVGEIGERTEWNLTVEKSIPVETQYGKSDLYLMTDADGNVFKWFTSSRPVKREQMIEFIQPERPKDVDILSEFGMEVGWTYRVRGTIKDHEVYNGVNQTALSRCSVQEILDRPEEELEAA